MNTLLPDTWPLVRLKDVATIRYGKALHSDSREAKGTVPVYGSSQTSGLHDVAYHDKPSIIIGRKGSVGSVQYVDVPFWPIDTVFFLDEVSPHVDLRFLAAALSHFGLERYKIVVGVPGLNRDDLANFKFPLPPLSEQQRIVDILQEAEEIRRLRAQAEAKTAELIPAIFHDRFVRDQAHEYQPLHKLAEVVSGVAIGRKSRGMAIEVPYIRVANVQAGYIDLTEIKTTPATENEIEQYALQNGDVLLTEGGDFDKLGRGALWEGQVSPCIHQNHVFRVRANREKLLPRFFAHYLQSARAKGYFLRCAKKTTNLASINLTQLMALPVPVVPLEEQEAFEAEIESASKAVTKEGERLFAALSRSLSAHAFTGQLTAVWRVAKGERSSLDQFIAEIKRSIDQGYSFVPFIGAGISRPLSTAYQALAKAKNLTRDQSKLAAEILELAHNREISRYFTSELLAERIKGPLHRHPQAIESHLTVFAVRGIVIPVSRPRDAVPGKPFAASYRLPMNEEGAAPEQRDDVKAERMRHQRTRAAGKR